MRPHIICHMGTSIDGRLHPSRFTQAAAGISRDVLRAGPSVATLRDAARRYRDQFAS